MSLWQSAQGVSAVSKRHFVGSWWVLGLSASAQHFCHWLLGSQNSSALQGEHSYALQFPWGSAACFGGVWFSHGKMGVLRQSKGFGHTRSKGSSLYIQLPQFCAVSNWKAKTVFALGWRGFLLVMSGISQRVALVWVAIHPWRTLGIAPRHRVPHGIHAVLDMYRRVELTQAGVRECLPDSFLRSWTYGRPLSDFMPRSPQRGQRATCHKRAALQRWVIIQWWSENACGMKEGFPKVTHPTSPLPPPPPRPVRG